MSDPTPFSSFVAVDQDEDRHTPERLLHVMEPEYSATATNVRQEVATDDDVEDGVTSSLSESRDDDNDADSSIAAASRIA